MKPIRYTVARKTDGSLINAGDAEKGISYFCPQCDGVLILRKSGKNDKGSKRPHYAHKTLTPNCTPETALHYVFKNLLGEKINQHLLKQIPLEMSWNCFYCGDLHSGDLLKKISFVQIEPNFNVCRPDIGLFDREGNPIAVVEVIVTHSPDAEALRFYDKENIVPVKIQLTSDNDIKELDSKVANPDFVGVCRNPKCRKCGQYQQRTRMTIIDAPCWKCRAKMKIAVVHGNHLSSGTHLGPERFTKNELAFARNNGVVVDKAYSNTSGRRYLANICPKCRSFVGEHYLFISYFVPAVSGEFPKTDFEIGYHCNHRILDGE